MEKPRRRSFPDFLIIGRPKCGTTSVARWLAEQPEVFFCRVKESRYFSGEWQRGFEWYSSLYDGARPDQLVGEATPDYTHPDNGETVADRIATSAPDARLLYLIRNPLQRVQSAFRHRRLTGEEPAETLLEAVQQLPDVYLGYTMYYRCLEPFIDRFPKEQLLVIRTEDLDQTATGWYRLIDHLGLAPRARPDETYNLSDERSMYRPVARALGGRKGRVRLSWVPGPLRQLGKQVLKTRGAQLETALGSSRLRLPDPVLDPVWADIERLEAWLGLDGHLWSRGQSELPSSG